MAYQTPNAPGFKYNNMSFIDEVSSSGSGAQALKDVVIAHIRRIAEISSQEMTKGYWEKKPMQVGGGIIISETYHPDLRESYCNAVDFLIDIVEPESDKEFIILLNQILASEEAEIADKKNTNDKADWIGRKLYYRRWIFKEINKMFYRNDYFTNQTGLSS